MKIFICCSKHFYDKIEPIREYLESKGHIITLPNSYNNPFLEEELKQKSKEKHIAFKSEMIRLQEEKVKNNDAILVLNYNKNGQQNYIGGGTFLEMYEAFKQNKKIFLYNPVPEGMLKDEIVGFNPVLIEGDLEKIVG